MMEEYSNTLSGELSKDDFRVVVDDLTLRAVPVTTANGEISLILNHNNRSLRKLRSSPEDALGSIVSLFNTLEFIPRDDRIFPKVDWSQSLSEAEFNEVLLRVAEDIMHRIEVIDREELESEFTMRNLSEPY